MGKKYLLGHFLSRKLKRWAEQEHSKNFCLKNHPAIALNERSCIVPGFAFLKSNRKFKTSFLKFLNFYARLCFVKSLGSLTGPFKVIAQGNDSHRSVVLQELPSLNQCNRACHWNETNYPWSVIILFCQCTWITQGGEFRGPWTLSSANFQVVQSLVCSLEKWTRCGMCSRKSSGWSVPVHDFFIGCFTEFWRQLFRAMWLVKKSTTPLKWQQIMGCCTPMRNFPTFVCCQSNFWIQACVFLLRSSLFAKKNKTSRRTFLTVKKPSGRVNICAEDSNMIRFVWDLGTMRTANTFPKNTTLWDLETHLKSRMSRLTLWATWGANLHSVR